MERASSTLVAFRFTVLFLAGHALAAFWLASTPLPAYGQNPPPAPLLFYVDPQRGSDEENVLGHQDSPLKSVTRALELLLQEKAAASAATVFLRGGMIFRDVSEGGAEKLPLRLPPAWWEGSGTSKHLSLEGWSGIPILEGSLGSPPGGGPSESSPYKVPFFELEMPSVPLSEPAASEPPIFVEFRRLHFSQGLAGMSFLARRSSRMLSILVENCELFDQAGRGIELFQAEDARVDLTVRDSIFLGSSGGVLAETGRQAHLSLWVEGCTFQSIRSYGPGGGLGSGVDVHLDERGDINARIQRNQFRGLSSAVQLTASQEDTSPPEPPEAPPEPKGGTLVVKVLSNLIGGRSVSGVPGEPSVKNGIYLSLWPHHHLDLQVLNNTFVALEGAVIFRDNAEDLHEIGLSFPWTFANNICRAIGGASEFDAEVAGVEFPPAGATIRSNLLEKSRLSEGGEGGNLGGDPGFVDEESFDFRLRPGSRAIDRGDSQYVEDFAADLDGNCRSARVLCSPNPSSYSADLGAFESPGFCSSEPVVFRRGDCNQTSGDPEIGDAVLVFGYLFLGKEPPKCQDACDTNDDGKVEISDGIYLLSYLFLGGRAPPPPFEAVGHDPTLDCLPACKNR